MDLEFSLLRQSMISGWDLLKILSIRSGSTALNLPSSFWRKPNSSLHKRRAKAQIRWVQGKRGKDGAANKLKHYRNWLTPILSLANLSWRLCLNNCIVLLLRSLQNCRNLSKHAKISTWILNRLFFERLFRY
jgi:hypothetical protein